MTMPNGRKAPENKLTESLTRVGIPTRFAVMPTATLKHSKAKKGISILQDYDIAADAKNRISLRGAKTKYFHVQKFSNGCFVLEPRELVRPAAISARAAKMLRQSVANLRKGKASAPVGRANAKQPSCYDLARDLAGSIKGLPRDIATNPKYMEGFGE